MFNFFSKKVDDSKYMVNDFDYLKENETSLEYDLYKNEEGFTKDETSNLLKKAANGILNQQTEFDYKIEELKKQYQKENEENKERLLKQHNETLKSATFCYKKQIEDLKKQLEQEKSKFEYLKNNNPSRNELMGQLANVMIYEKNAIVCFDEEYLINKEIPQLNVYVLNSLFNLLKNNFCYKIIFEDMESITLSRPYLQPIVLYESSFEEKEIKGTTTSIASEILNIANKKTIKNITIKKFPLKKEN